MPSAADLGPLPPPPADLAQRALPLRHDQRAWRRIHACAHGALYFNRAPTARFNAPAGEYGVMYLGVDLACCFVETFGRLDAAGTTTRSVSQTQLLSTCIADVSARRPLALVDLTGPGLRRIDADARLFAGPHAVARLWGLALWAHPAGVDGIIFPSRHDPSLVSLAVFDRAQDAVQLDTPAPYSLGDLPLSVLGTLLDRYDFSLRPS